jgi:hypothetical protein
MARGTLTIYDVPPEVRAKGAAQARQQLHMLLSNPHLTARQKKDLLERLAWISKWESANVEEIVPRPAPPPEAPPPPPAREPQNHTVELTETLTVKEADV